MGISVRAAGLGEARGRHLPVGRVDPQELRHVIIALKCAYDLEVTKSDVRSGQVYQGRDGRWHAWRRGRGELGVFRSKERALLALSRSPKPKKRKGPTGDTPDWRLFGNDDLPPSARRLSGNGDNRLVFNRSGRKIGAVTRAPDGRFTAWNRTQKLSEHATAAEAEAEVHRVTQPQLSKHPAGR